MQPAVTRAVLARLFALSALLGPVSGCISELVVEVQPPPPAPADAGVGEEDAGPVETPDAGPLEIPDGGPVGIRPVDEDARTSEDASASPKLDGGVPDAARDSGPVMVLEAGTDAGCDGGACDAGFPPSPCPGGCDLTTLIAIACDGGGHQVCWSDGDGTCSLQCPAVRRCSPSQPCADDEWCFFENNDCGDTVSVGYCAKRRASCLDSDFGVCGCDGVRYPNPCVANQAGTSVRANAVCR